MRDTYKVAGLVAALFMVAPSARATDPIPPAEQKQPPRIVASPTTAVVQPTIPVGAPVPLDVGKFVWLDLAGHAGPVTWDDLPKGVVEFYPDPPAGAVVADHYPGIRQGESARAWHKAPNKSSVPCFGINEGTVKIAAWASVDGRAKKIAELTIQVGPRPPPDVKPDPDKPDVKPVPVTSFRVILGYESAATMTQPQVNVLYGSVVESWLNENCTGGKSGWRRRDKDAAGDADPTMAALWSAVQKKITAVPFAAVEVNGKVEIIPLEATPAAMVEKLKSYKGVK